MTASFLEPRAGSVPSRPPRPLTVAQAAHRIGCSARQARRLAELGEFPGAFRIGIAPRSPWSIPQADIEAFIARSSARERASALADFANAAEKEPAPGVRALAGAKK